MAAGVHAGPTTPRSGGIVSFGSIITCAPVRAISQLHPLGTECGHRLYFSLFVFITSTATRNADSLLLSKKREILRKPKRNQDYVYISIDFLQSLKLHLPAPKKGTTWGRLTQRVLLMVAVKKQPSWFKVLASGVWRWQFLLVGFGEGFLGFRFSVRILHMSGGHGHGCLDVWTSFLSQLMSGLNSHTLSLSLSLSNGSWETQIAL